MNKFLTFLAGLMLTACVTAAKQPEPSPYDGKCYSDGGAVLIKIYHRDELKEEGKEEMTPGYKFAVVNLMFGQYGEGVAPEKVVENDLATGALKEAPCDDKMWADLAKEFAEWKKQQEAGKKEK